MPTRDETPLGAPCWTDLYTSDTAGAEKFYGELFGWTAENAGEEYGGYINFSLDGVRVAGCMHNDGSSPAPDMWSIYLRVADAAATTAALKSHGGEVYVEPMPVGALGTMVVAGDSGGAGIGMWEPAEFRGFAFLSEPGAPDWFELHTRDYDGAIAFYRDVFGWDLHTAADEPDFRYSTLGKDDDALAGIMDATNFLPEGVPAHWSTYWKVTDADATCAKVADLGGAVVMAPEDTPYGRLAIVSDHTGTPFKLRQ